MIFDLITIFLVGVILLFAAFTALQFLGKFPRRDITDVVPYLRRTELEELDALLDPVQEKNLKFQLSPLEFRYWQRKRVHLMYEYLLRMSHNALVLIEWGNMESGHDEAPPASKKAQERQALAQEMVRAATELRLYSLLALLKLKFWIVLRMDTWPLISAGNIPALREVFGINALATYTRVRETAGCLGGSYGLEYQEQLTGRI